MPRLSLSGRGHEERPGLLHVRDSAEQIEIGPTEEFLVGRSVAGLTPAFFQASSIKFVDAEPAATRLLFGPIAGEPSPAKLEHAPASPDARKNPQPSTAGRRNHGLPAPLRAQVSMDNPSTPKVKSPVS